MSDLIILKALSERKHFMGVYDAIPKDMIDTLTQQLLKEYHEYFNHYPSSDTVDYTVLSTAIRISNRDGKRSELLLLIENLQKL